MIVYVLKESVDRDNEEVIGVFSTQELAEAEMDRIYKYTPETPSHGLEIIPFEVDGSRL